MRSRPRVLAITLLLGSASPALAADHLMKVNEVMTSNGGNTSSQFIELQDPGELFSNPPYAIEVFSAAGTSLGSQTIVVPASTTRFLIATTQAQTDFPLAVEQATLTVALPTSGQVCFRQAVTRIHCFSWGVITSVVEPGTESGAAPADGQSVQRTTAGYLLGTPTPGAANIPAPVVDGAPDAGAGTADASGAPDGGCDTGGSTSWFALIGLAALVLVHRSSVKRR